MRRFILNAALIIGISAAIFGPLLAVLLMAVAAVQGAVIGMDGVVAATLALACAVIGLGLGLPLALSAYRALRGRPAGHWRMPGWGWWLAAFIVVLLLGRAALAAGLTWLVPAFHVLAGVLPALLLISLTTRRGRDLTGRQIIGGLSWGGLASTAVAIAVELALVAGAALAAALWISLSNPGLLEQLQETLSGFQSSGAPADLGLLQDLVASPLVLASVLGGMTIVVPLVEEMVKGLIVPLVMLAGAVPTRRQAFLLGVASGAGFALFESILNGAMALMSPEGWGALMLVRGATAAVHGFATGLVALGWQAILVEKRWSRGFALGLLGVVVHGFWNLGAGMQTLTAVVAGPTEMPAPVQMLLSSSAVLCMALVWVAAVTALLLASRIPKDA